jgi:hypothetical protein
LATIGQQASSLSAEKNEIVNNNNNNNYMRKSSRVKSAFDLLNPIYPNSTAERFYVSPDKISWSVKWPEYEPNKYTLQSLLINPEADLDLLV